MFTNENMFNLNGADGAQYYWHNTRDKNEVYSKKVRGGP